MDAFLETQRQVMGAYLSSRQTSSRPNPLKQAAPQSVLRNEAKVEIGPWLGTIREHQAGRKLIAVRVLDRHPDPVAEHPPPGGRGVSALDPSRRGLPVVPFTVMAEMLAQAAVALVPGTAVTAFRDVQAHRWIRYEDDPVTLEITAERDPSRPDEVV